MSAMQLSATRATRELRNAFGTYPTGVAVVTCRVPSGRMVGVTANSFVSLSLSPPLVSVAFHTGARHVPAFLESAAFAINILCSEQCELSSRFARPSECSWDGVAFRIAPSGHVVLEAVAAVFLCKLFARHEVGDHLLLVGQVEQFAYDVRAEPIAFLRGRYGSFRVAAYPPPPDPIEICTAPSMGWG